MFKDTEARKAIEDIVEQLGGGSFFYNTERPVILFNHPDKNKSVEYWNNLMVNVDKKIYALAEALGYEFKQQEAKLVAKKKEKKVK